MFVKLIILGIIASVKNKFYLTTPIYYVNDKPHIGHACTTVAADILARFHKLTGDDVFFLTGTDEHGAKVAEEAKKDNLTPQEFTDKVSKTFQDIWPKLGIETDYFIRTTNPEHKKIVQEVIEKINKNGDIYKGKYEGYYCLGCEKFITETEAATGICPLHPNQKLQKQSEENYFFKLSKYAPILIKAIEDEKDPNHYEVLPAGKKEEILARLKAGIEDVSISRANVAWGIPLPIDEEQTIYVWIDALLNYYTALKIVNKENYWPTDLHLVGKEILWFHAVIWEAMLLSAGLTLPKKVFAHSFYTIDGQKMSKSQGNVIAPEDLIAKFCVDGARYLIASSFPYDNDSDVGWQKFTNKYNADLANGLGNLIARTAKLCEKDGLTFNEEFVPKLSKEYKEALTSLRLPEALDIIMVEIKSLDQYINNETPWKIDDIKKLEEVLSYAVNKIRQISFELKPFLPETAEKIEKQFAGPKIKSGPSLFPRLLG